MAKGRGVKGLFLLMGLLTASTLYLLIPSLTGAYMGGMGH
jgi:hypothetical protein